MTLLKAPFPWTGGKSTIADKVWSALGDVGHYIEPFCGSMAVLLARSGVPQVETVNDLDHYLVNFWRSVQRHPQTVADHAVNPLSEVDLSARNEALIRTSDEFRLKIEADPDFCDPKLAGWWVWGQSTIIGRPFAHDVCKKMPSLFPMGVNAFGAEDPRVWMAGLAARLRHVRILYGDWSRCLGSTALGLSKSKRVSSAGVFLDPPYADGDFKYASGGGGEVWEAVRDWAIEHGKYKHLRIVLAGYEDGRDLPEGWTRFNWLGHGGLGRKSGPSEAANRGREVLWLSPHCLNLGGGPIGRPRSGAS